MSQRETTKTDLSSKNRQRYAVNAGGQRLWCYIPTLKSSHYQKPTRQQMFFYTAGLKKLVISLLAVAESHKAKRDHTEQKAEGCNSQQSSSKKKKKIFNRLFRAVC